MNTYLVLFENGFAIEPLEGVSYVVSNYAGISILAFPSKEMAYCEGCRQFTARKLTYPWYMPNLPHLEDMTKGCSIFIDSAMIPVIIERERYFCGIYGKYAGIFTNAEFVVNFLQQYPAGRVQEVGSYGDALSLINRHYLMMIYPMSAYVQSSNVPIVPSIGLNTAYELPYFSWMKANCNVVGPFEKPELIGEKE